MHQQKRENQAIWIFPIILCKTKKQRTCKKWLSIQLPPKRIGRNGEKDSTWSHTFCNNAISDYMNSECIFCQRLYLNRVCCIVRTYDQRSPNVDKTHVPGDEKLLAILSAICSIGASTSVDCPLARWMSLCCVLGWVLMNCERSDGSSLLFL